jgi:cellobiose phosphorylase
LKVSKKTVRGSLLRLMARLRGNGFAQKYAGGEPPLRSELFSSDQIAADVYALSPHTGRGGLTWYTGSAGWMYRLILESLLGLRLEVDKLWFTPCLPADWKVFKVHYRYRETLYRIDVLQTRDGNGGTSVTVDGIERHDKSIPLVDDHQEHSVEVRIPAARI